MAHFEYDEYGSRWHIDDQGNQTPAPELSALGTVAVQAGKQMTDFGRGVRSFFGEDVSAEAAEANRYMAPVEEESPYLSMLGQALPSAPGAAIGGGGFLAGTAIQGMVGALEGYLDYDPQASGGQRAAAGALGGVGGEWAGRALGRVMNMTKGFIRDLGPRGQAQNPFARDYEELGGETLAYQRLDQDTPGARFAERAAQGAESAANPPPSLRGPMRANDELHKNAVLDAVGIPKDGVENLGTDFIDAATDRFNRGFRQIETQATDAGPLKLGDRLRDRLLANREVKAAISEDDLFGSLKDGVLEPGEYIEARESLSDGIRRLYNQGQSSRAKRHEALLSELDNTIGAKLDPTFKKQFDRLREQYRVFSILESPGVINSSGVVNVKTLKNKLSSKASGFGRKATGTPDTVNPETAKLIGTMKAADRPEFKAFRSSGTAENLSLRDATRDVSQAMQGALQGDPLPAMGAIGRLLAPGAVGLSQMGGGNLFNEAFNPAARQLATGGGFIGRSLLDEQLYPFVGAEDERLQ